MTCLRHPRPQDFTESCPACVEERDAFESGATRQDNVIRLVPQPAPKEGLNRSIISMLEQALDEARNGEFHLLVLVGRQANGGVAIRASQPCDEIHAAGLCEAAKGLLLGRMRRG